MAGSVMQLVCLRYLISTLRQEPHDLVKLLLNPVTGLVTMSSTASVPEAKYK